MDRKNLKRGICTLLIACMVLTGGAYAAPSVKKDESVYVILNSDGTVKEKIVSDWLQGSKGLKIEDQSILENIENVKGDEVPTKDGETLIWELENDDLFYQGTTDKELPLEVDISYFLDGEKISPEELGGKSGKVKICVKIENKDGHNKTINGNQKTVYTPFMTMVVMNLSNEHFDNIEVNRGEVVSDGKNQVVTFVTIPGLKESLDIDSDILDLDVDEVLEVTADVENFDMGPIMIVATPDIPSVDKIENADNLDELEEGLNELKDAVEKLCNGTDELAENMELFYENFEKLESGAKDLGNGIRALSEGIDRVRSGALELKEGIGALGKGATDFGRGGIEYSKGASEFAANAKVFADGTKDFAGGVAKLSEGSQAIAASATELSQGTKAVSENTAKLSDGLGQLAEGTGRLNAGQQEVVGGIDEALAGVQRLKAGKIKENKAMDMLIQGIGAFDKIAESVAMLPGGDVIVAKVDEFRQGLIATRQGGEELLAGLEELEQGLVKLKAGAEEVNGGLSTVHEKQLEAAEGAKQLAQGTAQLNEGTAKLATGAGELGKQASAGMSEVVQKFQEGSAGFDVGAKGLSAASKQLYDGANALNNGGVEATIGADKLAGGLGELSNGANQLEAGASEFVEGSSLLGEGARKLADGSKELNDGMHKFDEEGIQKIDDELSDKTDDIKTILDTKDELVDLSKNYRTFTGVGEDMDGSVKFIMKTEEIEGNDEEVIELEEGEEEKTGFFEWIKGWFKKVTTIIKELLCLKRHSSSFISIDPNLLQIFLLFDNFNMV